MSAATIRIRRSATNGDPAILAQGEMSYSYAAPGSGGDRLYIGTGTETAGDAANHEVIGGKFYVDLLGGAAGPTLGQLTASQAIITDADSKIDNLLVDNIQINGNTISSTSGDLIFSATGSLDFNGEVLTNAGAPSGASDVATKGYVDGIVGGSSITLNTVGDTGTGSIALANSDLTLTGGTGIETTASGTSITFDLSNVGTAGTYGSATQIPQFTTNAQGQVTSVTEVGVSIPSTLTVNGDAISLTDSDLTLAAGEGLDLTVNTNTNTYTFSGEDATSANKGIASFAAADFDVTSGAVSIATGGVSNTQLENNDVTIGSTTVALGGTSTALAGLQNLTVDNINVNGNTISSTTGTLFLDPGPSGDSGDLVILGNLTVQGTTTTINSTEVTVNDLTLTLADSAANAAAANGAGIIIDGANATFTYASSGDKWVSNKPIEAPSLLIGGNSFQENVDDAVANLLLAGEGIDLVYNDGANSLTISGEAATITNLGLASFDSDQFTVTAGAVSIYDIDGGTY